MVENKKSDVRSQESGIGATEKVGIENKKSDVRSQESGIGATEKIGDVKKVEEVKKESKPAIAKVEKKKEKEKKVELEREYVVPLRKGSLNVPQYRRAKKAVKVLKEFMVRHMNVRDGDLRKVKVDIHLNNEIWFRGIKKPLNKIKVLAKKVGEIVYVELADVPEVVRFKMAREAKMKAIAEGGKKDVKAVKKEEVADKDKDGVDDKVEEKEDEKAEAEKAAMVAKGKAKELKHTAEGKHLKKTTPVRKSLKK
ncbi:60S ribosomal protein L31 [Candidatus Pacearchaeota archaeon]|nr:60S ribosomal protein L31 [Candidatus Pacearchaeota archaeon]